MAAITGSHRYHSTFPAHGRPMIDATAAPAAAGLHTAKTTPLTVLTARYSRLTVPLNGNARPMAWYDRVNNPVERAHNPMLHVGRGIQPSITLLLLHSPSVQVPTQTIGGSAEGTPIPPDIPTIFSCRRLAACIRGQMTKNRCQVVSSISSVTSGASPEVMTHRYICS